MEIMVATQTDYSIGQERAYEKEININTPGNSPWIIIPEKISGITVTLTFSGSAFGKVQTTTDLVYTIKQGSPKFVDWPYGVVNYTFTASCYPVSGIRVVHIGTGAIKMTVRAQ